MHISDNEACALMDEFKKWCKENKYKVTDEFCYHVRDWLLEKADIVVENQFPVDADWLAIKANEGKYWKACEDFYNKQKKKRVGELSAKMIGWIEKIHAAYKDEEKK